ncbi:MAG: helix-turn-helix transcriptional regulator [Coriobacteriales bacterium]|nr:helix-turn-helix transcriptional regulator [Coriobacteriales bacterium]
MSSIDDLIQVECDKSTEFAAEFRKEKERLSAAIALMKLREEEGMTQRQLAVATGKTQSTIARIENGNMNPSVKLLSEIADALGRKLEFTFAKM